jgi:probable phosphoglycerate mutase
LIRHGQTELNKLGIVQGSGVNTGLNETGKCQAFSFYEKYKDVPFKKIYTSALSRTVESVSCFINRGIPHEAYADLNEIYFGDGDGKDSAHDQDTSYACLVSEWRKGNTGLKMNGSESPEEVRERLRRFINLIFSRIEEDTILVAMHGRAMRILLTTLFDMPLVEMDKFSHSNLCLYVIKEDQGKMWIELANDVSHLVEFPAINFVNLV